MQSLRVFISHSPADHEFVDVLARALRDMRRAHEAPDAFDWGTDVSPDAGDRLERQG
jgi:hypothetical protein